MSAAKLAPAAAPDQIRRGTLRCAALVVAVAGWCAATVIVCGAQPPLRAFLDFGFGGVAHTPSQAVAIAAHNAAFVAAPLIAAVVIGPLRAARVGVEIILAALLITNSALVGLTLGAYGTQLAVPSRSTCPWSSPPSASPEAPTSPPPPSHCDTKPS